MITSHDLFIMDTQLCNLIHDQYDVSPELLNMINAMSDYLNAAALSMAKLEAENVAMKNKWDGKEICDGNFCLRLW